MDVLELFKAMKEVGIPIGAFALCAYIVIFIVKRLSISIDKLVNRLERFTDRVRIEHEQSAKRHEALMEQHSEMIKVLGRINGYTSKH